jgi:hypothetical protein
MSLASLSTHAMGTVVSLSVYANTSNTPKNRKDQSELHILLLFSGEGSQQPTQGISRE